MHAFRLSIALAVASCAFAPSAKADLTVCNSTPDQITVASAWVSPSGGFTSEGWWKLRACGGCERVVLRSETSDPHNYFFYAHGGGREWRGNSNFCTNSGRIQDRQRQALRVWTTRPDEELRSCHEPQWQPYAQPHRPFEQRARVH